MFLICIFIGSLFADIKVSSSEKQTTMIELFSSEGCSSCPPAEKWINNFKNEPELWSKFIPIVYHVDYWDYIGWKDSFAKKEYTLKQRQYYKNKHLSGVYTPGFLINSKEWRAWFNTQKINETDKYPGVLSVNIKNNNMEVTFNQKNSQYDVNIALLGFGFKTVIKRGENKGEILEHDFVVLEQKTYSLENSIVKTKLFDVERKAKKHALVVWVTKKNSMNVVQSTGTWIDFSIRK